MITEPIRSPFTILVDQREQKPYFFEGFKAGAKHKHADLYVPTMPATLETGDYTISGLELEVAVERKSKSDFLGCIGNDRPRFEEQFKRLNELKVAWLIVEAPLESVQNSIATSKFASKSIVTRTRSSWNIKYPKVHWIFCNSVREAEAYTFRNLEMYYRKKHNK